MVGGAGDRVVQFVRDYGVVDDLDFVVGDAHLLAEFDAHFLTEGDDLVGEFVREDFEESF